MEALESAAQQFESLKDSDGLPSGIPFERTPKEIWGFLDSRFPGLWPQWFQDLTATYRLGGGWFYLCLDPYDSERRSPCMWRRPSELLVEAFQYFEPIETLASLGLVPFADGEDANVWVFRSADGYDPEVFFTSLYGWSQDCIPTIGDGLEPANMKMSEFLLFGAGQNE